MGCVRASGAPNSRRTQPETTQGRSLLTDFFFFFSFCSNFPKTRARCGGSHYRISRGSNARASDRIIKTSGAREGYPLDRAAGGALTPRGATVPRESEAIDNLWRDKAVHGKEMASDCVLTSPMSVSRLCRLDKESSRDARLFLRPSMA